MSTVTDVSSKLGEYMLKGWILTDNICSKCSRVPLMRSPSLPVSNFCANCDGGPKSAVSPSDQLNMTARTGHAVAGSGLASSQSSLSLASSSHGSRSSTPPTEISSALSSPVFAPPMDTEETLRRRQQSDTASAELGRRMLRGWAMLAEECPNPRCYGVPLVRPPKTGSEKDPRKECVICGGVYVIEKDVFGQEHLVPYVSNDAAGSSRSPAASVSATTEKGKGKAVARIGAPQMVSHDPTAPQTSHAIHVNPSSTSTLSALEVTAESLELSLQALSHRLKYLASMPTTEPSLIAQAADAISKVSAALTQVKQLQWNEYQAHGL